MAEQLTSDSSLWGWIRNLAEANMIAFVVLMVLFVVFLIVAFAVGFNLIGTHVLGRQDKIVPVFLKWMGRKLIYWIPRVSSRIKIALAQSSVPKRPLSIRRRIFASIGLSLYFIAIFGIIFLNLMPDISVSAFSVNQGGVLVEYRTYRQPTDGIIFGITFDKPARIIELGNGEPIAIKEGQINYQVTNYVNLRDAQELNYHIVSADYPIATPKKSVFVYFKPLDGSNKLGVLSIKLLRK